jgi:hypothetical protein
MAYIHNLPVEAASMYNRAFVERKPERWSDIVHICIRSGETNADKLADIPFFLFHPDLNGRTLKAHETTLISKWKVCRGYVWALVPAIQYGIQNPGAYDSAYGRLRDWLPKLSPHHLSQSESNGQTQQSMENRIKSRTKFHAFMIQKLDHPHQYSARYDTLNYRDGDGYNQSATKHGHTVIGFKKATVRDAFRVILDAARNARDDELRTFERKFFAEETFFYDNIDVFHRWSETGKTNDGTNAYVDETRMLNEALRRSRNKTSIYSVHNVQQQRIHSAMNDSSPNTAGLPF